MSYSSILLARATVETLKGATLAGNDVSEAPFDPAEMMSDAPAPKIAVFVGGSKFWPNGGDMIGAEASLTLVIQIMLPAKLVLKDAAQQTYEVSTRQAGGSVVLHGIAGQVLRALQTRTTTWAEIWRDAAQPMPDAECQGIPVMFELESGIRVPAYELRLEVQPVTDPVEGELTNLWQRFLEELKKGDAEAVQLEGLMRHLLAPGAGPEWRRFAAAFGLSDAESFALGYGPQVIGEATGAINPVPVATMVEPSPRLPEV